LAFELQAERVGDVLARLRSQLVESLSSSISRRSRTSRFDEWTVATLSRSWDSFVSGDEDAQGTLPAMVGPRLGVKAMEPSAAGLAAMPVVSQQVRRQVQGEMDCRSSELQRPHPSEKRQM
jgi:hypothetical protein